MSTCAIDKDTNVAPRRMWPLSSVMPPLAPLPTAPACARALVSLTLVLWGMGHLADSADMVTSELVTNAVKASSPYYLDARIDVIRVCLFADRTHALIEVWDQAAGAPQLRAPGKLEESGRGLTIVAGIADRWGWWPAADRRGKCVWAELSQLTVRFQAVRLFPPGRHVLMAYYSPGSVPRSVLTPNSRLAGTGLIADDLYLIASHEVSGKPYLPPRALGAGLAGGLLAELMDADTPVVMLHRGYLVPVQAAGGAPVARYARIDEPVRRHVLE
ncbi:MAG: ATP-binding protein, partial [Streptosporangiaceae bacterium]